MSLEVQILLAVLLDAAAGDPRWLPHPVRGIYALAKVLEGPARGALPAGPRGERLAGLATALVTYAAAGGAAWGLIAAARLAHPLAGDIAGVLVIYTTIAARDLARHASAVLRPLERGDLPAARRTVAMIVGRDTAGLDEAGVTRAAVESVAESTVDGVTAPLLFALAAGPVGAMVYRAINTLDSTFGYKDDRYRYFGWASARIDDAANWLPARLTAPLIALAAALTGQRAMASVRTLLRDGRKHESPNAGLAEAAMAGALGVQLGGVNYYGGEALAKPTIGEPAVALAPRHIRWASALMFVTAGLLLAGGLAMRLGAAEIARAWRAS